MVLYSPASGLSIKGMLFGDTDKLYLVIAVSDSHTGPGSASLSHTECLLRNARAASKWYGCFYLKWYFYTGHYERILYPTAGAGLQRIRTSCGSGLG
jgi:hypothetical protein